MKRVIKLGLVCLVRKTFDFEAAGEIYQDILAKLAQDSSIELIAIEAPVIEPEEAVAAGKQFAAAQVDGIVVISGTFHLGHLLLEIKKHANLPTLLWGLPELPYNGGKIRLNSVCGVNLNASNLVKSGFSDFTYTIGTEIDQDWVDAVRMITALRDCRIGLIGSRAQGFFNVGVSELALYEKFGVLVDYYELADLWAVKEDKAVSAKYLERTQGSFDTSECSSEQVERVAALSAKLQKFAKERGLSALAIRCWPEFAAGYGISPCAAMSLVQADGLIVACEGDVDCAITMLCHQAAGAETPFMADLSQVDLENDSALMWHCGVAPCNLTDGKCTPTLDTYFAGGKGVTAGFVMRPGAINMARLDSIKGEYRLLQECGEALPMEKLLSGTYAKVRFDLPMQEILDKVIYTGVAHHVSMVYGDNSRAFEIFARLKDLEIL